MNIKTLSLLGLAFSLSACATVTRGKEDTVHFLSTPPLAEVRVEDMTGKLEDKACTTPCEMDLSRKVTFMAHFSKEGFSSIAAKIVPKVVTAGGTAMAGNVLIGGVIGAAVDGSTGAMNDLLPNPVSVKLNPEGTPSELITAMTKKEQKAAKKAAKDAAKAAKKAAKDAT